MVVMAERRGEEEEKRRGRDWKAKVGEISHCLLRNGRTVEFGEGIVEIFAMVTLEDFAAI